MPIPPPPSPEPVQPPREPPPPAPEPFQPAREPLLPEPEPVRPRPQLGEPTNPRPGRHAAGWLRGLTDRTDELPGRGNRGPQPIPSRVSRPVTWDCPNHAQKEGLACGRGLARTAAARAGGQMVPSFMTVDPAQGGGPKNRGALADFGRKCLDHTFSLRYRIDGSGSTPRPSSTRLMKLK
jgi:hypothetical protein